MNRRTIVLSLAAVLTAGMACAQDRVDPINADRKGLALQGYDPVAYFEQSAPKKGSRKIVSSSNGIEWRFSSEENKALFEADPAKYAPQYGGYCAFGTAMGRKFDGTWETWKVWEIWEQSGDAGGLTRGPIKLLLLIGFILFASQILAEMIKNYFVIRGREDLANLADRDTPIRIE